MYRVVWKTYRTKSAGDISYAYQAIYIFGCTFVNIYAISLQLWPVYVPCLIEETLIVALTAMKFIYSKKHLPPDSMINVTNLGVEKHRKDCSTNTNVIICDTERTDADDSYKIEIRH